jgi:hypothetical protein
MDVGGLRLAGNILKKTFYFRFWEIIELYTHTPYYYVAVYRGNILIGSNLNQL